MFFRLVLRFLNWFFPERLFSRCVGVLARRRWPAFILQPFLRWYCRRFDVDMAEAEKPLTEYGDFIEFFTRHLREGARTIDQTPSHVVSPVDGKIYACGPIDENTIFQAKGSSYSLEELLDDTDRSKRFYGGAFIIIYLSPRDYHRIHTPFAGSVSGFRYIPGKLLPVNPASVAMFPRLFVENERLTSYLETEEAGQIAVIKVGATIVGRIRLSYLGRDYTTNPWLTPRSTHETVDPARPLERAGEMGMFELGSTVILLFEPGVTLLEDLETHQPLVLGQHIATIDR